MSKGCSKCGTQNADAAKFCRGCGAGLGTEPASEPALARTGTGPVCRMCGHVNRSATRFCSKCGTDQTLVIDPDPATEPVDYSILAPLPPRAPAPAPTEAATHPAASIFGTEPSPKPLGLWAGLGVLVVALAVGGAWWAKTPHGSVTGPEPAASVAAVAPAPAPASVPAAAAPASVPAVEPAPVTASAPERAASVATPEPAPASAPKAEPAETPAADTDKAARDAAKAKALRERRALAASQAAAARAAEQEATRRRADEARAAAAAAVSAPAPPPVVAAPAPAVQARTAQETCAGGNLITRSLCESRECSRREHADEPLCQRLRATEERRRQQD